jgi:hypothetical protein
VHHLTLSLPALRPVLATNPIQLPDGVSSQYRGFVRNLRAGFYDRGAAVSEERHRAALRLSRAWAALTTTLRAA